MARILLSLVLERARFRGTHAADRGNRPQHDELAADHGSPPISGAECQNYVLSAQSSAVSDVHAASSSLSAHRVAVHAAAPCPRKVKEQMFAWWGPIFHEYYGGTELNGLTYERDKATFAYHNDAEKTRSAQHPKHPAWTALGDVGYVDDEGFLYLTDRASFMIISGGVNIYPQEIENELITHPKVEGVAVVGVPHADLGEEVKAIVQPVAGVEGDEALLAEGLYKRLLKDRYWGRGDSRIVQE